MYTSDKEAIILEYIYYNDSIKQRELADKAGISLGMVNAILRRLIEKGWLMTIPREIPALSASSLCFIESL